MNTQAALAIFFEEAFDQCNTLEALLLELNDCAQDPEALNAMFRSAHTIKGSAGLFGLDSLVGFTHTMESVLDRLRRTEIAPTGELVNLLLESNDQLRVILKHCQATPEEPYGADPAQSRLLEQLESYISTTSTSPAVAMTSADSAAAPTTQGGVWHIFLRYHEDLFRHGFDPSTFLVYLRKLGTLQQVYTEIIPPLTLLGFDPTSCRMVNEIALLSDADAGQIRGAFDFIIEESQIDILPPGTPLAEFEQLAMRSGSDAGEQLARWAKLGFLPAPSNTPQHKPADAAVAKTEAPAQAFPQVERRRNTDRNDSNRFIRIEAAKLDVLINRVGELVISSASSRMRAKNTGDTEMIQAVEVLSQLVEGIRDDALNLRMMPINEIFSRFPRMVHDVSQRLDKEIDLELLGTETEIDKSMVERLTDPLMHIVRNAIDHGIEDAETRAAAGKSRRGRVCLNAYHDTGAVVVDVSDDGRGMDKARILAKAQENGLVPEGRHLSEQEILKLVFLPGFSTAEQVSDLSGRGVGMDVVRRNIEALRGEIEIITRQGLGSTIRIRLPLTLAIIDGFHVEVDGGSLVLPLDMMSECMDMPTEQLSRETSQINLRGEWIPYVSLRELFGAPPATEPEYVVIVQFGQTTAGIIVDRLVGDTQAVIKPLGNLFRSLRGISGSTIMGNGRLALILDVPQLIQLALKRENRLVAKRHQALTSSDKPSPAPSHSSAE